MSIRNKPSLILPRAAVLSLTVLIGGNTQALSFTEEDYELKLLGKYVFFDKISTPKNRMSCATCHDPKSGGVVSDSDVNLHQVAMNGADPHTIGSIKTPTNAYASLVGPLAPCGSGAVRLCGGNFWNGRAEGNELKLFPDKSTKHIGSEVFQGIADEKILAYSKYIGPTADQALNPMPNPVEQNIDRLSVCRHVARQDYAKLYEKAWGEPVNCSENLVDEQAQDNHGTGFFEKEFDISFKRIILAVGAYQHSKDVNSFSSKRDKALREELACLEGSRFAKPKVCSHPDYINSPGKFPLVGLTDEENLGHDLFYNFRPLNPPGTPRGTPRPPAPFPNLPVTNCAECHSNNPFVATDGTDLDEIYTANDYHDIGIPRNPELIEAAGRQELGIFDLTGNPRHQGAVRTPTLRNVDKRKTEHTIKAYGHNGWFKSLESIVHFYNTAFLGNCVVTADEPCDGPRDKTYEQTTAAKFGITRCERDMTEAEALANNCWPEPAFGFVAPLGSLIGDLGMTDEQEAALVAYLKTLSDRHTAEAPKPYRPMKHAEEAH